MLSIRYFIITVHIIIAGIAYASDCAETDTAQYNVNYMPLDVQTYIPVTQEDIDSGQSFYNFEINTCRFFEIFKAAFNESAPREQHEDRLNIRIKITRITDGKSIYVNIDKTVIVGYYFVTVPERMVDDTIDAITTHIQKNRIKADEPYQTNEMSPPSNLRINSRCSKKAP